MGRDRVRCSLSLLAAVLLYACAGYLHAAPPIQTTPEDRAAVYSGATTKGETFSYTSWGNLKLLVKDKDAATTLKGLFDDSKKIDLSGTWLELPIKADAMAKLVELKFFDAQEGNNVVLRHLGKLDPADYTACVNFEIKGSNKFTPPERFEACLVVNTKNAKRVAGVLGEQAVSKALFQLDGKPRGGRLKTLPELVQRAGAFKLTGTGSGDNLTLKPQFDKRQTALLTDEGFFKTAQEVAEEKAALNLKYAEKLLGSADTKEAGKQRLQAIVKDYPGTPSAKRAQELLDQMK